LYTIVDDLYQQHAAPVKPGRPGPPPTVSDSEVLTLALCGLGCAATIAVAGLMGADEGDRRFS